MSALKKQIAVNNEVEDGFFDDFPPYVIKKYNLKVSGKAKDTAFTNKRQKLSENTEAKKLGDNEQNFGSADGNEEPDLKSNEKVSEINSQINSKAQNSVAVMDPNFN